MTEIIRSPCSVSVAYTIAVLLVVRGRHITRFSYDKLSWPILRAGLKRDKQNRRNMGVLKSGQVAIVLCALVVLQGYAQQNGVHHMSNKERKVFSASSFSWNDCGDPSLPGHVKSLILTPDPLDLPGNISVGFSGVLNVDLTSPVVVDVEVQKKVVFWITVPCIEHVGSCNYPDACPLLEKLNCPPIFTEYGIPCKCPITAGTYNLPPSIFFVDDSFLPSVLTNGQYKVTVRLSQNGNKIGCLYIEFQITR